MTRSTLSHPRSAMRLQKKPVVLEQPVRLANATPGRGTYTTPKWNTRPGSEEFLSIPSKGF